MDVRTCYVCGETTVIWDLERHSGGLRHRKGECPATTPTTKLKRPPTHDVAAADAIEAATSQFNRPEDGSQQRFIDRRAKQPWAAHTFWWALHNVVAHPLIGLVPIRMFFRFHDWTSRRMHGR